MFAIAFCVLIEVMITYAFEAQARVGESFVLRSSVCTQGSFIIGILLCTLLSLVFLCALYGNSSAHCPLSCAAIEEIGVVPLPMHLVCYNKSLLPLLWKLKQDLAKVLWVKLLHNLLYSQRVGYFSKICS